MSSRPSTTMRRQARGQCGFTLIELMVTVAIALFLLGGLDGSTNPGPAGTSQAYTNVFTVVPPAAGVPGKLLCTLNDNPTPVALVSGVQGLSIYYGVKRNPGVTDYNVDTYLTADQMLLAGPNGNDWGNISSVRVILTFTNPLAGQPGQQPTIIFERVIEVMARAGVHT
ncbi:MAG: prepilin-type N-terminal cleavage/methylation domain-containing protein [Gammaproteobacteria bacterium]|nr:MAG: prepilin-type N-terminal cleavage/methylation domain-containing protein [Gammaproteobacteria bacterium]